MTQLKKRNGTALLTLALVTAAAGCDGLLDVENPNQVAQEDVDQPVSASALVNGTGNLLMNWDATFQISMGLLSDEMRWVGSLNDRGDLGFGNINFLSSDVNGRFSNLARLRWFSDLAVERIEEHVASGAVTNSVLLARAYLFSALTYTRIAEHYEDFVFSDRVQPSPPIGPQNMGQVWATAFDMYDKALSTATAVGDTELRRETLANRARARHAAALGTKLKAGPYPIADPLVHSAEALADIQTFFSTNPGNDWQMAWGFSSDIGTNGFTSDMNSRREARPSDVYVQATADNRQVAAVTITDPLTNDVDPVADATIMGTVAAGQYGDHVVVSARELRLIWAEAALQQGDTPEFETQINLVRSLDGLPDYTGQIPALEMLQHSRQVNLLFMHRRLHDQYRFGIITPEWIPTADALVNPGKLFPIGFTERVSNCYIVGTC